MSDKRRPKSLYGILERWKNGDQTAIEDFFNHSTVQKKMKPLIKRYARRPIKTGDTYQFCFGSVDGHDVAQTVKLVFLELVIRNLNKQPKDIIGAINTESYYMIMDSLMVQHGCKVVAEGWRKLDTISLDMAVNEVYDMDFEVEHESHNPYGFSDRVWDAIQQLRPNEREAILAYYGDCYSLANIAREMGLTKARIHQILFGRGGKKKTIGALEKLKTLLKAS